MVSSNFIQNIQKLGKQISLKITIGNRVFEKDGIISCTKSFNGDMFKSIMQYVDIELDGLVDVNDQEINIQFGVCMEEPYEYIDWGSFIVDNDTVEKSIDKNTTKFTAYDYLCKSCVEYTDLNVTYPIALNDYLNVICEHLGYTLQTNFFTNSTNTIDEEKFLSESYTFRDVLDQIAGASASVIVVKGNNLYVKYPTDIDFTIDENNLKSLSLLDKFGPINSIVLSLQPQEDNYYKQDLDSMTTYGLTEIKISNNEIMNKNRELFADNILDKVNGLSFYPFELESFGYTFFDPYDLVTIKDLDGNEYKSLILNDTVTVTTGLNEKISTSKPETTVTDYSKATSDEKKLNRVLLEVDKQNQTIKGIVKNQEETDQKISEFELSLDGIKSSVESTSTEVKTIKESLGIEYQIESSLGYFFESESDEDSILTARIFKDGEEIDPDGNLNYTWYCRHDGNTDEDILGTGKTINLLMSHFVDNALIYFTADDSSINE